MPRIVAFGLMVLAMAMLVPTAVFAYTGGSSSGSGITDVSHAEGDVVEQVAQPWIGVSLVPLNEQLAQHLGLDAVEGIVVVRVHPESPAAEAGFEQGDIVLTVGAADVNEVVVVVEVVGAATIGDTLDFGVLRGTENLALNVMIGERPILENEGRPSQRPSHDQGHQQVNPWVGMVLVPLNESIAERLELDATEGIVMLQIREDSPAATAGIEQGDIILSVGDVAVTQISDIVQTVREAEAGTILTFTIARQGEIDPVSIDITIAESPTPQDEGHGIPYLSLIAPMAGHLLEGEFTINDREDNQVTLTVISGAISEVGEGSLVINSAAEESADLTVAIGENTVVVKDVDKDAFDALAVDDGVIVVIKDGELVAVLVKPLRQGHQDRQEHGQFPRLGSSDDQDESRPRLLSQGRGQEHGQGNNRVGFSFQGPQFRGNAPDALGEVQERFRELQERFSRIQGETRQRSQSDGPRRGDLSESITPAPSQVQPAPTGSTNL
jgi:membrane-associated protease RseP (regulator of RpoE activity)